MKEDSWKFKVVNGVLRWVGYVVGVFTYLVGVLTLGFYRPAWLMKFSLWTIEVLYGEEATNLGNKKK